MNITTNRTLRSKLFPEVSYSTKKFSEGRRQQLALQIADAKYRMYDLIGQADALLPKEGAPANDEQTNMKRSALIDSINELVAREMNPIWIKNYVTEIHGLSFNDVPATTDTFIADAPSDLYNELVELIKSSAEMDEDSKNDSGSVTTSTDPAPHTLTTTSAIPVKHKSSTPGATANSSQK